MNGNTQRLQPLAEHALVLLGEQHGRCGDHRLMPGEHDGGRRAQDDLRFAKTDIPTHQPVHRRTHAAPAHPMRVLALARHVGRDVRAGFALIGGQRMPRVFKPSHFVRGPLDRWRDALAPLLQLLAQPCCRLPHLGRETGHRRDPVAPAHLIDRAIVPIRFGSVRLVGLGFGLGFAVAPNEVRFVGGDLELPIGKGDLEAIGRLTVDLHAFHAAIHAKTMVQMHDPVAPRQKLAQQCVARGHTLERRNITHRERLGPLGHGAPFLFAQPSAARRRGDSISQPVLVLLCPSLDQGLAALARPGLGVDRAVFQQIEDSAALRMKRPVVSHLGTRIRFVLVGHRNGDGDGNVQFIRLSTARQHSFRIVRRDRFHLGPIEAEAERLVPIDRPQIDRSGVQGEAARLVDASQHRVAEAMKLGPQRFVVDGLALFHRPLVLGELRIGQRGRGRFGSAHDNGRLGPIDAFQRRQTASLRQEGGLVVVERHHIPSGQVDCFLAERGERGRPRFADCQQKASPRTRQPELRIRLFLRRRRVRSGIGSRLRLALGSGLGWGRHEGSAFRWGCRLQTEARRARSP